MKTTKVTRPAAPPTLATVATAELGSKPKHNMSVDVAIHGTYLYATHSYTPNDHPHHPDGLGDLVLLDLATLAEVRRVRVGMQPRRVAVHRFTGRAYMICSTDTTGNRSLVLVDPGVPKAVDEVELGWGPTDVAVNATTGRVYVANWFTGAIRVFDVDGNELTSIPVGKEPIAVAVDETRNRVYAVLYSTTDNRLVVIDGASGTVAQSIPLTNVHVAPQDVAVDETRDRVYVSCVGHHLVPNNGPSVYAVTPGSGAVHRMPLTGPGRTVDVDPIVDQLYVAGENRLDARDAANGALKEQTSFTSYPGRIAVDRKTGLVYVGENETGRVVAYRSAVAHPAPPPPLPSLAIANPRDKVNLFRQAPDGSVQSAVWTDQRDWWDTGFAPIGGTFPPNIRMTAMSRAGGRWDLFGIDAMGDLWGTTGIDQAAGPWHRLGGGFAPNGHLTVLGGSGTSTVFTVDATGTVRSLGYTESGPDGSDLRHEGEVFAPGAPITIVSRKPGHWDLFVLHPDGRVRTQWWGSGEGISAWAAIGGEPFAPNTALSCLGREEKALDVFAVRPDGRVCSAFWHSEDGWSNFLPVADGGSFPPGAPVAVTNDGPENITLSAVGTDAEVYTSVWRRGHGWDSWHSPGATPGAEPGATTAAEPGAAIVTFRRGPGEVDVCWLGRSRTVGHAWWNGYAGAWSAERGISRTVGERSTYHFDEIHTDSPLKGHAKIVLWEDGSYIFRGHMHGSGFDPYDFVIQAAVQAHIGDDAFMALDGYRAGHVDGWEPFGDEERSYDWYEMGVDPRVLAFFHDVEASGARKLLIKEKHENVGVGGALGSLVNDVIDFFTGVVDNPVTRTLVVAVALGRELEDIIGIEDLGANGWLAFSILTVGNAYWLQLPAAAALIPMLPGGPSDPVLGGKARQMEFDEWEWAQQVFGGTLPHFSRIWITNLKNLEDGAFVNTDGEKFLVHLGEKAYEDPMHDIDPVEGGIPAPGATFIHELTHVWDAYHSGPLWETEAMVDQFKDYDYPNHTRAWSNLSVEEKAIAIAEWYRVHHTNLDSQAAHNHRYFRYVRNHLRAEVN